LPIIAQSPFFMSLYGVLHNIASGHTVGVIDARLLDSARHAHIFGAPLSVKFTDSTSKIMGLGASAIDVRVVTIAMIVLMSLSQFYTQRQLMTKNVDMTVKTPFMQQQKMLLYVFPVMFAVFGINFPVGVLVYWLTTNVWTMGQQMFVIRRNPTPGSLAYKERQERLRAKGKIVDESAPKGKAAEGAQAVKRQQPKRQTKAQRQSAGGHGAMKSEVKAEQSSDEPQDAKPSSESVSESVSGSASGSGRPAGPGQARGGQRKGQGQQRSKHPSKK
jgi:YidC/Oxa1 family membrane protein insertase